MDLEEVTVVEEVWDLDFGEALPLGLMLVWEEEDCRGVGTFLVEQRVYLGHGQRRRLKPIASNAVRASTLLLLRSASYCSWNNTIRSPDAPGAGA